MGTRMNMSEGRIPVQRRIEMLLLPLGDIESSSGATCLFINFKTQGDGEIMYLSMNETAISA